MIFKLTDSIPGMVYPLYVRDVFIWIVNKT